MKNEKHPHKLALIATHIFNDKWIQWPREDANEWYELLFFHEKEACEKALADIMQAADVPQPAKMPLLSAVEIIRDHNEWRKANSEDEAPMPYSHIAELVWRAMERVCELVPEYVEMVEIAAFSGSMNDFAAKFPRFQKVYHCEDTFYELQIASKELLEK